MLIENVNRQSFPLSDKKLTIHPSKELLVRRGEILHQSLKAHCNLIPPSDYLQRMAKDMIYFEYH